MEGGGLASQIRHGIIHRQMYFFSEGNNLNISTKGKDAIMTSIRPKIYCAGPLFTPKEREEMQDIAFALEEAGYSTFLPQRDGLELTSCVSFLIKDGISRPEAELLMARAIFSLDIYQVLVGCDALVANLNGRVPDEGTVSEAAMAWSNGKPVVGFKADTRTAFDGQDNPLVSGLFEFKLCNSIDQIIQSIQDSLVRFCSTTINKVEREEDINRYTALGELISSALEKKFTLDHVVAVILNSDSLCCK
jgi:nucleoside 2-deoxyribosyltransferase